MLERFYFKKLDQIFHAVCFSRFTASNVFFSVSFVCFQREKIAMHVVKIILTTPE